MSTSAPTTIPTVSQRAPLFVMGVLQGKTDTEPERPARSVTSAARATAPVVQGLPGGHFQSSWADDQAHVAVENLEERHQLVQRL